MRNELFRIDLCDFRNEKRWNFIIRDFWGLLLVVFVVFVGSEGGDFMLCCLVLLAVSLVVMFVGGLVVLVLLLVKFWFCFWCGVVVTLLVSMVVLNTKTGLVALYSVYGWRV